MSTRLSAQPLHPTFAAVVEGVDFSKPLDEYVFDEIKGLVEKYGVCVFRSTGLSDEGQIEFARRFGELERLKGTPADQSRLKTIEMTDQSNLEVDGELLDPGSIKSMTNKGNGLFHVDTSYNVRRARFSVLRGVEVPPMEAGGNTDFADTRTAWDELPPEWKAELLEKDYVANHSFWHSRKMAAPKFFEALDPDRYPFSKHRLVQLHKPSGRMNLYVPSHIRKLDGLSAEESKDKVDYLFKHATGDKYTVSIPWHGPGDMMVWDNTCTLHRATELAPGYRRDMRRCGVLDDGEYAYGLNPKDDELNYAFSREVMLDIIRSLTSAAATASK